jgi:phospholipid-translocating P-type ATPase (flippase)
MKRQHTSRLSLSVKKDKITVEFGMNNSLLDKNKEFPDNKIITTKYNPFTFFPKSLLLQFRRAANIYFLIVSILTCMSFSPKQPSSMIGTFAFVLLATMVKEAIEDYGRYKQDRTANNRLVLKYTRHGWELVKCSTLCPGDLVKILKEEEFSADCLIIKSSNESGYCYIDTKSLDGETNLKAKCAIEEFKDLSDKDYALLEGSIECEKPDENLVFWEGLTLYKDNKIYVELKNLILKGCCLKNTDYTIGVVVYTGVNTKIMKNSKKPRQKISKVLLTMNTLLYSLFIFLLFICLLFSGLNSRWISSYGSRYSYIFPYYNIDNIRDKPAYRFGFSFLTLFVAYSQIIPISLYVALEVVKIIQGVLIFYDPDMYDYTIKKPASTRTTDLIEELGQVDFIFSDKTGTLTQNSMILKKCYINGKLYGENQEDKADAKHTINGDHTLARIINSTNNETDKDKLAINDFFYLLSLCHEVFPERTDRGLIYQGSSPDDIALVQGAQQLGIEFVTKDYNFLSIHNHFTKETKVFEQLVEIPFSSARARMSVIVREKDKKLIYILSKGADSKMLTKINIDPMTLADINETLNEFSKDGLRILVMAKKEINEDYYKQWERKYNIARNAGNTKDLEGLYDEIEQELNLVGCSAIEDKLQDGVPDTINHLINCNIRIWVLTGDKQDTALEIAKSCKLVTDGMEVINMSCQPDEVRMRLGEVARDMRVDDIDEEADIDIDKLKKNTGRNLSVIINGVTLENILNNETYSRVFFLIAVCAKSVICCRVSPKQKAKVVQLIKQNGKFITLSIGDGANDVPMIMEAHIGVGIQGKEGTQAVRSADYAIGQFRFLDKLLLVYGRDGYMKITKFICYYFYKNIILVVTEFFLAIYSGFSGQIYFADYLGTMYNAFFTSWPCLFTFSLEKEHNLHICQKFPVLYRVGQKNELFTLKVFWSNIAYSFFHSICAFYLPNIGLYDIINSHGDTLGHWYISTISFSCIVHIVTIKLLLISNFWNFLNLFSAIGSVAFYYVCVMLLSSPDFSIKLQPEIIGVVPNMFLYGKALIVIIFAPFIACLPDITIKQIIWNLYPTQSQYLRRYINTPEVKKILAVDDNFQRNQSMKSSRKSHYGGTAGEIQLKEMSYKFGGDINLIRERENSKMPLRNDFMNNEEVLSPGILNKSDHPNTVAKLNTADRREIIRRMSTKKIQNSSDDSDENI